MATCIVLLVIATYIASISPLLVHARVAAIEPPFDACIEGCLSAAAAAAGCSSSSDMTCICSSVTYQAALSTCIQSQCLQMGGSVVIGNVCDGVWISTEIALSSQATSRPISTSSQQPIASSASIATPSSQSITAGAVPGELSGASGRTTIVAPAPTSSTNGCRHVAINAITQAYQVGAVFVGMIANLMI